MKRYLTDAYRKLKETNIVSNFFNLSSIQLSNTLLIILIIPIITRIIGLEEFGVMMFASRFSQLAGTVVNYGTNQSGVRDVAANKSDTIKLSAVVYQTLWVRIIFFILFLLFLAGLQSFHLRYYNYLLFALPMVFAEVVNPLFFFIGVEKLRVFNLANLLSNVICILLILAFVKGPNDAAWVNFILGGANAVTYLGLLVYIFPQFKVGFHRLQKRELREIGTANFYLTINNISVQLQQSIMIFALTKWGNPSLLGAYSLCDRIIGQCRSLLITISNAIYPKTVQLYQQGENFWNAFRRKTKFTLAAVFFAGSVMLFLLADFIVFFLSKEHNATAVIFLKTMAIVPTISALNVLNVIDLLLKNNTVYIFRAALMLLVVSLLTAFVLFRFKNLLLVATFTLIVETCAWLLYEYFIRKPALKNV